ncbi:MAG TPA: hypothetical protein DCM32_03670 [Xanthomonadaceae bacterium]|nr:hypothetical protein [Xanthomonadaceae bacterium]
MSQSSEHAGFIVVPRRASDRLRRWAVGLGWPLSLLLLWGWMVWRAEPALTALRAEHARLELEHAEVSQALERARQDVATLRRSDQISRAANVDVQQTLAERDEEIAALRADVEFYERLVGATGQRRGLTVHAAEFQPETGGSWRYAITLTQNLNRAAVSSGRMRFAVEGVLGGALATVDWNALRQADDAPGQEYSFRYFQRLDGSIVLPAGFTPQRVRVTLDGGGGRAEASLPWQGPAVP